MCWAIFWAILPHSHLVTLPGVDVMITLFCDFCQFSAENERFSQKQML
jgi:hypothetical protein